MKAGIWCENKWQKMDMLIEEEKERSEKKKQKRERVGKKILRGQIKTEGKVTKLNDKR